VEVHAKDCPVVEGILKSIDIWDKMIEIEDKENVWFFNLHKITAIKTIQVVTR
jgi:hypothetical protein